MQSDPARVPRELHLGRTFTLLGRALRLRCPRCGRGRMFRRWVHVLPECSHCHFRFERGEADAFIGAYTVNLIVSELIVVAAFVAALFITWPDVPWDALKWGLLPVAVIAPLITLPFSKAAWIAIDLIYRPVEDTE